MKLDEIRTLFAYDAWANDLVLDALAPLGVEALRRDLATSHRSIFETVVHLVAAEEIWLSRWRGSPKSKLTGVEEVPDFDALRAWWGEVRSDRDDFVGSLSENDLEREITMATSKGVPYRHRLADMFRHVVNHSTYHRGQVVSMLRQIGEKPPATDLIRYYRENSR